MPDLLLISCGFDSKKYDIMGGLGLTARGYSLLTRKLMDLAQEFSSGRIVSILEGGYTDNGSSPPTFYGLAQCAMTHVRTLLTGEVQEETPFFTGIGRFADTGRRGPDAPYLHNGVLYLNGAAGTARSLTVTDLRGRIVYNKDISPGRTSLRLSSCCPPAHLFVELRGHDRRIFLVQWNNL